LRNYGSTFLSTHADRQGVDLLVTVCLFVCVCLYGYKFLHLAASNFARRFISVEGKE